MVLIGDNYIKVSGYIKYPKIMRFNNNSALFICSIGVPLDDSNGKLQYISGFKAWNDMAEDLYELGEGTFIKVIGHIETSNYNKKCRICNDMSKVYDKEFVVDFYKIEEG